MASSSSSQSSISSEGTKNNDNGNGNGNENKNSEILTAKYIEEHTSKKDLASRLRNIVQILREDESIEADSSEFPGLDSLCQSLVPYATHRDKQVRLYTVSACMELFGIFAPDAPWNTEDTLEIFRQTIRQLANLAHTTSPTQTNFSEYFRILELLAQVKIGVLLVELTKEENDTGALQVLCELFRTVLQSVRLEHPPEIAEMAQLTISGCLEEFYESLLLPIPLLDEILICIGQGPIVLVTNPQKAAERRNKKLPPHQIEQSNPSYLVASSIVRKAVDRLSTPISSLLNDLLNNEERATSESSILTKPTSGEEGLAKPQQQNQLSQADVWSIIYELHKIAPSILTTVIGNLSNFLSVPEVDQRRLVIKLLGRLFVKSPKLAVHFRRCYRDWLEHSKDISVEIRLIVIDYLLQLIPIPQTEISDEAQQSLSRRLEDPSTEVRLKCIHGLCDVAYNHRTAISLDIWQMLGTRLSSKFKQERKDTLTGLAQVYYKHFTAKYLEDVEAGGDDCSLEIVQHALITDDEGRFSWIPSQAFLCASWTDDAELRSRLWQVIDDLLLGSELPNSTKRWNPTARAVGLAMLLDKLQPNAMAWLKQLFKERAKLQTTIGQYIDVRSKIKSFPSGSEEALAANAEAQELLERIGSMTTLQSTPGELHPTLEMFHEAKDNHIFRILSTIATPTHTNKARIRALDELPKRSKVDWMKVLVRRCAMGDFLNSDVVHHSTLLAQECFNEDDLEGCKKLLAVVELAADIFPELCAQKQTFEPLMEIFMDCHSDKAETGLVTALSAIISKAAQCQGGAGVGDELKKHLLSLSCRDGTPEQARHAVNAIAALAQGPEAFDPLMNSLASPSRLKINPKLIGVLVALGELADCSPDAMASSRGQRAISFAMDQVILGGGDCVGDGEDAERTDEENDDNNPNENKIETPMRKRKSKSRRRSTDRKHSTPRPGNGIFDDEELSVACRTICAAIEFLASHIRSSMFASRANPQEPNSMGKKNLRPEDGFIDRFFDVICQILRDHGMPPSKLGRAECHMRQDRAAIRTTASLALLWLCDARLGLEQKFLSPVRWHILSAAFLDDEKACRDRIMLELGLMLTGNGKFGRCKWAGQAMAPSLRFFSLLVFCVDGEHGAVHGGSNGNAANVGKRSQNTKADATEGVVFLRKAYEEASAQARAKGPQAEEEFEKRMKTILMPEYVVPYALHLLSFRRETPAAGGSAQGAAGATQDEEYTEDGEIRHRILRKRLKWVFDPVVLSLGDSAGNLSFLLRMVEIFGKAFRPVLPDGSGRSHPCWLDSSEDTSSDGRLETAKLQVICAAAREVLLSYVKKDVNLAAYPGSIQVPGLLFQRRPSVNRRSRKASGTVSSKPARSEKRRPTNNDPLGPDGKDEIRGSAQGTTRTKKPAPSPSPPAEDESRNSRGGSRSGEQENHGSRRRSPRTTNSPPATSLRPSNPENSTTAAVDESPARISRRSANSSIASRTRRSLRLSQSTESSGATDEKTRAQDSEPRGSRSSATKNTGYSYKDHYSPGGASHHLDSQSVGDGSISFGGLSPIRAKPSPREGLGLSLSSGEKTRGTTPPSIVRNTKFSASVGFDGGATASESPTSEISATKPAKKSSHGASNRSKDTPSQDKRKLGAPQDKGTERAPQNGNKRPSEGADGKSPKRRKRSVPAQIKIVRNKLQDVSLLAQKDRKIRSNKSGEKVDEDNLDFVVVGDMGSRPSKRQRNGGKENRDSRKNTKGGANGVKENQRPPDRERSKRATTRR